MDFIEHRNHHNIRGTPLKQHWQEIQSRSPTPGINELSPSLTQQQQQHQQQQTINNINNNNNHNHHDEVDNRGDALIDYHFESARRESYRNWPLAYMDPCKLSAAGFYYTGINDRVKCFECGIEICQWVEGDNPMSDHQRWRANCRFIRKIPCGNVPIGVDPTTIPQASSRSRDVCGTYGEEIRPNATPDFRTLQNEFTYPSSATLGSLGIARPKRPAHPEYASYDARLRTFDVWPKSMPQTKEQLVDAGFYYTGTGDQTQCYHCGGGLKDWEPEDDPWKQHASWFTKCYYVLTVKGQAYINSVIGQNVTAPTKEETMKMDLPSYIQKVEQSTSQTTETPISHENNNEKNETEKPSTSTSASASSTSILTNSNKPQKEKNSDDARLCKICYNEELGIVFLPCGHIVACVKCAPGMVTCAVCRGRVDMTVRAIIS
ncbi:death-associated inhibitor of apoptosis 1-like [Aphidius gifuensis]|nr:death-associated inhibitor of apoptosis 1-like [Aphidius gifuensis]